MATKRSRELAAQAWCTPSTSRTEMDTDLAEEFAKILDRELRNQRRRFYRYINKLEKESASW